jgi:c-di-GMP-binding flagellar brake protein YcgR
VEWILSSNSLRHFATAPVAAKNRWKLISFIRKLVKDNKFPLADIENIHEDSILPFFTELQADRTPLKMRLGNHDETHQMYITDIRKRKRALYFLVTPLDNHPDLCQEAGRSNLKFEFTDRENIKYVFETGNWKPAEDIIWVKFPDVVQRFQRRKLYRLEAPHGTRLYFNIDNTRYKLLVINVSLGGTLGVLVSLTRQMEGELKIHDSKTLDNVELVFPAENRKHAGSIVKIDRCQIKRRERNPVTHKFECAIEFQEISERQQKNLTDLFYKWQREYLRRRKLLRA